MSYRIERTPDFQIFGHGQQRKAVIEAIRLLEQENSKQNDDVGDHSEDPSGLTSPRLFKDRSKKWQKFVTQVSTQPKRMQHCLKFRKSFSDSVLGFSKKISYKNHFIRYLTISYLS